MAFLQAVGSSSRDRVALASPLGALHFAGEGTSEAFPSTVHGALLAGRRAASEVVGKSWSLAARGIKHGWKILSNRPNIIFKLRFSSVMSDYRRLYEIYDR